MRRDIKWPDICLMTTNECFFLSRMNYLPVWADKKSVSILRDVYASFWNPLHGTRFLWVSPNPRIVLQRYSLYSFICLSPTEYCNGITVGGRTRGAGDIEPSSGLFRKWVHHVQPEMKVGKFKIPSMRDSKQNIHEGDVKCSRLSVILCL